HAAPGGFGGPGLVVLGDDRRRVDEVTVVEVVVVELGVAAVGGGVAGQGPPVLVVAELVRAARGEPVLQLALDQAEEPVPSTGLADLLGDGHELGETAERLAGPVGVGRAGEGVRGAYDVVEVAPQPG